MKETVHQKRQFLLAMAACLAVGVMVAGIILGHSSAAFAANSNDAASQQTVPGQVAPAIKALKPMHATSTAQQLNLSIGLNLHNVNALNALIAAQNDPHSASYHQYLTPQQFAQAFAPSQTTINSVTAYLRGQGLNVTSVASNHLLVNATGTVAQAEKAFHVSIADYALHGRTVYSPTSDPTVPASLNNVISTIAGLDNVAQYKHHSQAQRSMPHTGPGGGYTPTELRTAYDINSLISNGDNGSGQTVALFELDGYTPSDINAYLSNYSLGSAKYSNVYVDGTSNTAGAGAIEVELDMEVVSAIAPGATQKIYIGPNSTSGVNDTYNKIVTDDTAKVTSTSWGECEADSGSSELNTLDNIFKQAAAQGQAIFAAAGDSGAYDCGTTSLAVDSPADDPNVVGVGGTTLNVGSGGTYQSESVWGDASDTSESPEGAGGGGGVSTQFARPSYQTGTNLTNAKREVPDVSADADPNTGYSIYCTVTAAGCSGGWTEVGGTSAATPLWAASAADTNQYLAGLSKATLGSASADLYKLYNTTQTYSAYHDITSGNNLYYNATSGYDLASGIGSPDVWNFARDLAGTSGGGGGGGGGGGTTTQLLSNAGFESGSSPWVESSTGGYEIVDSSNPHTGSYSAYLCGYSSCTDTIYQTVALPSTTTKAVLSFWSYIDTYDSGSSCSDTFTASLRTTSGTTISTVQSQCNTNTHGWTQYTFDVTTSLSSYKGKSVEIYFKGTTKSSTDSDFYVDDVAFNVTH